MQKLFQKLITMHAYFMRKVSSLNIYSPNLKNQESFTLRPVLYHEMLQLNAIAKNTRHDIDHEQHPCLHQPPSCVQHPVS